MGRKTAYITAGRVREFLKNNSYIFYVKVPISPLFYSLNEHRGENWHYIPVSKKNIREMYRGVDTNRDVMAYIDEDNTLIIGELQ